MRFRRGRGRRGRGRRGRFRGRSRRVFSGRRRARRGGPMRIGFRM